MTYLRIVIVTLALLLMTGMAQPAAANPDREAACAEALTYLDQYTAVVAEAAAEESLDPFAAMRVSHDWLLANDPPDLFAPIHATLVDLFDFMLNESVRYLATPEAMASPIAEIMSPHSDAVEQSYESCPELKQAMLDQDAAATPTP